MIIYGWRNRINERYSGQFHCPKCDAQRAYKYMTVDRYLTLFFIPVLRLARMSEYVECQTCLRTYTLDDLAGIPANSGMVTEFKAQSLASMQQKNAGMGCAMAVIGGILLAVGMLILLGLVVFQLTDENGPTYNLVGFFGLLVLCPLPMVLVGLILTGAGIIARRKALESGTPSTAPVY